MDGDLDGKDSGEEEQEQEEGRYPSLSQ